MDRIDVRLRDADGREHHVVANEDPTGLSIVLVLSEPDQVPVQEPVLQSARAHDGWTYDLRIDTSAVPPKEAAGAVLALLA